MGKIYNSILELIGTKKALEAYAYPEGKPKKTVTRVKGIWVIPHPQNHHLF